MDIPPELLLLHGVLLALLAFLDNAIWSCDFDLPFLRLRDVLPESVHVSVVLMALEG